MYSIYRRNRTHLLKTKEARFTVNAEQEDCATSAASTEEASLKPVVSPVKDAVEPTETDTVQVKTLRFGRVIKPPKCYAL